MYFKIKNIITLLAFVLAGIGNSVYAGCFAPGTSGGSGSCPSCASRTMPANDCAENPLNINACGAAFTISSADMCAATADDCCGYASCGLSDYNGPAGGGPYADCCVGLNFDCTGGTNDFTVGSMENSLFWSFTTTESCDYVITMTADNFTAGTAVQIQSLNVSGGLLPTGTIEDNWGGDGTVYDADTYTNTVAVTAGNQTYIVIDGNANACADVSVSVLPTAGCTGCSVPMNEEFMNFRAEDLDEDGMNILWNNLDETEKVYAIERSINGTKNYQLIHSVTSSELKNNFIDNGAELIDAEDVYYRIKTYDDFIGKWIHRAVDVHSFDKRSRSIDDVKYFDINGREFETPDNMPAGIVITVKFFGDGRVETSKDWNYTN